MSKQTFAYESCPQTSQESVLGGDSSTLKAS